MIGTINSLNPAKKLAGFLFYATITKQLTPLEKRSGRTSAENKFNSKLLPLMER
jgi:hypothetical protein